MTKTGDPDSTHAEDRGATAEQEPAGRSSPVADSFFSEAIDRRTRSIRARGRLDSRALGMLHGTVEALHRSGWGRIVLDLGQVQAVDDAGLQALHALEMRIAADGGHVALLNAPEPGVR